MFKIVKCKGVLLKAMNKRTQHISAVSFFIATIPIIIVCLANPPESNITRLGSGLLLWYMISIFSISRMDWESDWHKFFTLPVWLSLKVSVLIFKFFLIRKYPEMSEEHYERWVKLKRLKTKINKR